MRLAKILSLDPGGTTGFAITDGAGIMSAQLGPEPHHIALWNLLDMDDPLVVVCESFVYQIRRNQGVDMPGVVLTSVEYIGIAKLWCLKNRAQYVEQTPSQAKKFWTDDKLKKLKLYRASAPHAMDAVRHLLYYITFTQMDNSWVMKLKL